MKLKLVKASRLTTLIRFVTREGASGIVDFEATPREVAVRYDEASTIIFAGLGEGGSVSAAVVRSAAAQALRAATSLKRTAVVLDLSILESHHEAALEGAVLANYRFDKYLGQKAELVKTLEVLSPQLDTKRVQWIQTLCEGVFLARDLVNENASVATPSYLAKVAQDIAQTHGLKARVLTTKDLEKEKMGLLLAVGRGSESAPRLIILEYRGNPESSQSVALVGKGVTFDTGGLNLKPSNSIETMRCDMAGAAAVLGAMQTIAAMKAPLNVVGICPAVCNAIDGASYFPGDIYSACDGTTVEICNTDAEGRLALGDAIAYARKKYELSEIIDIATLTGGVLTTFSTLLGGLFANDDALAAALFEAGEQTHERLWRLPLYEEFTETMKGDRSVLRNLSTMKRGYASSITGAAFIKHFVGTTPWAHLDIAGTAFNEGEARAELPKQATGYGVRLLVHYLLQRG